MAFDITPYIDMKPSEVRKLIREGIIDFPTAGMCRGYAQANLIILPPEYAGDFAAAEYDSESFCKDGVKIDGEFGLAVKNIAHSLIFC